jgi:hypothetical protein
MDKVNRNPFQKDQCHKIFMVLGMPSEQKWPGLKYLPDYAKLKEFTKQAYVAGCCQTEAFYKASVCGRLLRLPQVARHFQMHDVFNLTR